MRALLLVALFCGCASAPREPPRRLTPEDQQARQAKRARFGRALLEGAAKGAGDAARVQSTASQPIHCTTRFYGDVAETDCD